ncbi:hypothetical protein COU59_02940 [Candidatus Pacearchaeota archaeon CG10_big_fil_rev_8_21_14_0_10_34_12]|nr:MAG: hypothetical protein COU59_02940 [Candidatus Pacearchaeota archaeon CG10_big_fil_rev_8_21_14_0_10_34_12]
MNIRGVRENKKGISDILVSLIMIVIVLGAIGVVWFLIKGIIGGNTESIGVGTKCLEIEVNPTGLICSGTNNDVCNVVVERNTGGMDIAGIKLIFTNSSSASNFVKDVPGNIAVLEKKTISSVETGISNVDTVDLVVYFNDSSGKEQLCSSKTTYSKN